MPFKGAASFQKMCFGTIHYGAFDQKFVHAHTVKIDKIHVNAPIFGHSKGCRYNSRAIFNGAGKVSII